MASPLNAARGSGRAGPRALFAPAVAVMNRLTYPRKFALISALFLLPLALVMYLLISEINDRIEFTRKEMLGVRYLRPLRTLYEHAAQGRILSRAPAQGEAASREDWARKQAEIAGDIDKLQAIDRDLGDDLKSTDKFRVVAENWRRIEARRLDPKAKGGDDLYARLLAELRALIAHVGDTSNLILDPDLDTYYVMDSVLLKLPRGEDLLAQAQFAGKRVVAPGRAITAEERAEFTRLAGLLRSNLEETRVGLEVAFRNNPAGNLRPRLDPYLRAHAAATQAFLRAIDGISGAEPAAISPGDFDRLAQEALAASFGLWDRAVVDLDGLLQARIDGFARKKYLVEAFAVVALLVVIYLLVAFYLAVMRTVDSLRDASDRLVSGSIDQAVTLTTRDELGQVATSFNNIATQLRLEWTQAREESARARAAEEELHRAKDAAEHKSEELGRALQQLKGAQDQLIVQEKLASLGTLTAGIAHEIKNPLNFVTNFAQLSGELVGEIGEEIAKIKDRLEPDESENLADLLAILDQNVAKIGEHGRRADGIVRDMLAHSRERSIDRQSTDVNALLAQYVALAYHGMRARDASFNVAIEEHYDPALAPIRVNSQDLSRVFLNLVSNACYAVHDKKKAQADGFSPTITVTTKDLGDLAEIRIRDNGNGIPPAVRDRLFQPFFTTKPAGEGTGLGLSISYDIVVQGHQGTIRVESEEGRYAEFVVTLPATPAGSSGVTRPAPGSTLADGD